MFEKESKAYAERTKTKKELEVLNKVHAWGQESLDPDERRLLAGIQDREKARKQGFRKGAEFGYNKAFVEADKNLKAIVTDFNKANEWHYPSKGEYPKEDENVLCYCKVVGVKFYSIGHTIIGGDNKIRWWSSNRSEELKVYAWKEITPPKEIKK